MGQYYKIVNLDKKQYLYPITFGDGLKLMEFGSSAGGTMTALAVLMADGNGRGGGDFGNGITVDTELVGSWAGDRIVIAGDYADPGKFMPQPDLETAKAEAVVDGLADQRGRNLYDYAEEYFEDVSEKVVEVMQTAQEGRWSRWEFEHTLNTELENAKSATLTNGIATGMLRQAATEGKIFFENTKTWLLEQKDLDQVLKKMIRCAEFKDGGGDRWARSVVFKTPDPQKKRKSQKAA